MRYTIILAGTPQTTVAVAEALTQAGHTIASVICPFPKPVGRKGVITPSFLERWATQHNIPVVHVDRKILNEKAFPGKLPACDLLIVADFGFLIPPPLLSHPTFGALNIHPSLLPKWRGATPVPFTVLFGDKETGVTIIRMNKKFDTGAILAQKAFSVISDETAEVLLNKLFHEASKLLIDILPDYCNGMLAPAVQEPSSPTPYARRLTRDDGHIPFKALRGLVMEGKTDTIIPLLQEYTLPQNAQSVHRMCLALTPWPGVWTVLPSGKRVKILETEISGKHLTLKTVQVEGKTPMDGRYVKRYFAEV